MASLARNASISGVTSATTGAGAAAAAAAAAPGSQASSDDARLGVLVYFSCGASQLALASSGSGFRAQYLRRRRSES